jgi:hypothetical protein
MLIIKEKEEEIQKLKIANTTNNVTNINNGNITNNTIIINNFG